MYKQALNGFFVQVSQLSVLGRVKCIGLKRKRLDAKRKLFTTKLVKTIFTTNLLFLQVITACLNFNLSLP